MATLKDTTGKNKLAGTNAADTLYGLGGNDLLYGYGGNDTLIGGDGNDRLYGGSGNDILRGDNGNDLLFGDAGGDRMYGGAGKDVYYVNSSADRISEGTYRDNGDMIQSTISVNLGWAAMGASQIEKATLLGTAALSATGTAAANTLVGNAGANTLIGLGGNDYLNGGGGDDKLYGGAGNDTYVINSAGDMIDEQGATSTDDIVQSYISVSLATLAGGAIEHAILLGTANINAFGDGKNNALAGNSGANRLEGGAGADLLQGNGGNDTLIGGDGNDILVGGAGADSLVSGAGVDILMGGAGNDRYVLDSADVKIDEGGSLDLSDFADIAYDTPFIDLKTIGGGAIEDISFTGSFGVGCGGTDAANHMYGTFGNDTFSGGKGNDILEGSGSTFGGSDSLAGNDGDDTLIGGGHTYFDGGAGNDTMIAGTDGQAFMYGGTGADVFVLRSSTYSAEISDYSGAQGDIIDLSEFIPSNTDVTDYDKYLDVGSFFYDVRIDLLDNSSYQDTLAYVYNTSVGSITFRIDSNLVTYDGNEFHLVT